MTLFLVMLTILNSQDYRDMPRLERLDIIAINDTQVSNIPIHAGRLKLDTKNNKEDCMVARVEV